MFNIEYLQNDLIYVGASDRRLACFEGVYSVPDGVSYNSYVLLDEKTVVFDTVDKAVSKTYFENLAAVFGERKPDYLIISHMEPDHSATVDEFMLRYPETEIICSFGAKIMIDNYFSENRFKITVVKEGDELNVGKRTLKFFAAPMVHWPEVMVTYSALDKTLFSADAFGSFGAISGSVKDSSTDFEKYILEARRYYSNICGKYGAQVISLLSKLDGVDVKRICPLHGEVIEKNLGEFIAAYKKWGGYEPESDGVLIIYASVYGNTANACDIVSSFIEKEGLKTVTYDVSVTPQSTIVAETFKYKNVVVAATTYNGGIFIKMEETLNDIVNHCVKNRRFAVIENGSWAPQSGKLIREKLSLLKDCEIVGETVTIRSSVKQTDVKNLENLAKAISLK